MEREASGFSAGGVSALKPPKAARRPSVTIHHGRELSDDYAWLRAPNWQTVMREPAALDPEIRAYLDAENAYAAAVMADVEPLRQGIVKEMRGRIKEDDSSVPAPDGAYAYAMRYTHGAQH